MIKQKQTTKLSPLILAAIISGIVVIITASVTWFMYEHTVNLLTSNLRQRLLSIVTTQAANIDYRDIEKLEVEEDWKKPEWERVVNRLKSAKDRNKDIVYIYIFRRSKDNGDNLEFVADAESINPYVNSDDDPTNDLDANGDGIVEPDGADYLQWPGQEYPEPPEEAFWAFNGPLTSTELYEDAWGEVLTGYEPIYNDEGDVVAVLAVDIRASDFFIITRQTLTPFLLFVVFLVSIILLLTFVLIRIWSERVDALQELDRQKDELLSIVSHQLATPVTSIKWYLELLLNGDAGKLTEEQNGHLKDMSTIGMNLADLVSMILDVSRIQLGRMQPNKDDLDLQEFFNEILAVIKPKAKEKEVKFIEKLPNNWPQAKLDKRLTRMTIENLLSNAVKYTKEKGEVELSIEIKNNNIHCFVRDTGCGIPKKEQEQIFGKMFRASNVRNNVDGNGFGLYVAKGAIESQGGKIWFESEEGKGTTFFIELPLK